MRTNWIVLVIEAGPQVQLTYVQALLLAGLKPVIANSAEEGLRQIALTYASVLITDIRLPMPDGMSLAQRCHEIDPGLPVIMITGNDDETLAVGAVGSGACDFIQKPFSLAVLVDAAKRALQKRSLFLEPALLPSKAQQEQISDKLLGCSMQMQRLRDRIMSLADLPVDVLLCGETGTGKELVAQALHDFSSRSGAPFVALNCGAMNDNLLDSELFGHEQGAFTGAQKRRIGKIEHANGGTLFLDEVESMSIGMQIKLLRVLQDRQVQRLGSNSSLKVDVRVIAATKDDLLKRSQQKSFRADLYYRLNVVSLDLPPLRNRREDIPLLLAQFLSLSASRFGRAAPVLSFEQMHRLMAHSWPGNVRELRNAADCLVLGVYKDVLDATLESGVIDVIDKVDEVDEADSLIKVVERFERSIISSELLRQKGNIASSARALRIPKTTLTDKVRKYGLLS